MGSAEGLRLPRGSQWWAGKWGDRIESPGMGHWGLKARPHHSRAPSVHVKAPSSHVFFGDNTECPQMP